MNDRVTPDKQDNILGATKTERPPNMKCLERQHSNTVKFNAAKSTVSDQKEEKVTEAKRRNSSAECVKVRDLKPCVSRMSSASSIMSKAGSTSSCPIKNTRSIVLKDLDWLFRHSDMSGQAALLPRVTEIFYRL